MAKLMLALDVLDENKALKIIEEVNDYIDAVKIGYPLVLACGLDVIKKIKDICDKEVIADFKVADIPSTNEKIAKITLKYADGIIVHGFVGEDSVKAVKDVAKNLNKKVIMVTEMSHPGALKFIQPIAEELAEMAKKLEVDAIVVPSTRPQRLKRLKNIANLPIITPGVGAQGGKIEDILNELGEDDYVIVGRAIYQAEDPKNAAKKFKEQIKNI
ncbi:orotidine 5'-phosphate decarboxylase [Methanocaldococcus vulcanius M7]|uniref:Orotidine 5'-phosphate decarboxylase n=1 Tax=Methanocaldococcus vulcanius (strain ATCC 700851 / DSM 12094 / M7) TaxID=579137 RepID=C9RG57_METVM|nr:orotidine-5'-phosphate decarboxylase [Methanocaldococcus vulcanius]ACX72559.1 orotidine 5'-phosphate decarboxylase [Methanocaldococcus vulcanius M7]